MDFPEFERQMREQDPNIITMYDRGDGTCLIVKRLLFHYTLLLNVVGDFQSYEDRWCYSDEAGAHYAVGEWARRKFECEPTGWHRHHATGRRRPGGDASKEYINH